MMHKLAGIAMEMMQKLAEKAVDKASEQFIDFGFNMGKNCIDLDSNVQSLERRLGELSSQESDIKEYLEQRELLGRKKRKREVDNWLEEVKKIRTEFTAFQKRVQGVVLSNPVCGARVEKLEKQVVELIEQRRNFSELLLDAHENRGERRLTEKLFGEMFNQDLRNINQCLETPNIRSIGIYGMSGVGKTTLAKHINNHLLDNTDCHICWLTVSQDLSIKNLQGNIAKAVNVDLSEIDDEEIRAVILSRKLMQMKNFVIILDDLREAFCLKKLGNPLGSEGCRLILTTRSLQLCRKMYCQREFEVKTLTTEEAWELFKYVLGQETVLPTEVKGIAEAVAERCAGLPLRIIAVAERMKGVQDVREWRDALEELRGS